MNKPRGYGFNPQQLIRLRKERGLSQRQLALATGLARMGIVRYEQGMAEPRIDSVEAMARELGVEASVFFEWNLPSESPRPVVSKAPVSAPPAPQSVPYAPPDPILSLTQNLNLLQYLDLRGLHSFLEAITQSEDPLDFDQDLHDRDLAELQQTTPNALPLAREEFSLSLHDVSSLCGLSVERLNEIEASKGMPVQPTEIMALRQALGVQFDPRAVSMRTSVLSPPKDRRAARTRHHDSVKEWKLRCQRTPNKLDKLVHQLNSIRRDLSRLEGLVRDLHPEPKKSRKP